MSDFVFVSDFDGTITANDFYNISVERLLTPEDISPWKDYRAGKITHFTALQRIFGKIRAPIGKVMEVIDAMEVDPGLAESVKALRNAGWNIVVVSAGCLWYIDIILKKAGVELEVHANPGVYKDGGPLLMDLPKNEKFYSPETGVDKEAVVRWHQERRTVVAYAGDGFTDLPGALLVPAKLRFARGDLAQSLKERGERFQPFQVWSDMAKALLAFEGVL